MPFALHAPSSTEILRISTSYDQVEASTAGVSFTRSDLLLYYKE